MADDTMTLRSRTLRYAPSQVVTIRWSLDGWSADRGGYYIDDAWVFTEIPVQAFEFKFRLNSTVWQKDNNLVINDPAPGRMFDYDEGAVVFEPGRLEQQLPPAENGTVARSFFWPDLDEGKEYDVIVIGSGIGGGVVADAAADANLHTLLLEAGSYLYPTHIANLPRKHRTGFFAKHVWSLWGQGETRKTPYNAIDVHGDGNVYKGGLGYNLGGRSIFWGGFIPRMREYEFDGWPGAVKAEFLQNGLYDRAEELMKKGDRSSEYQERTKAWLSELLGDEFIVVDAAMAVDRLADPALRTISSGMFSTADLLMESRATEGQVGNEDLVINLNHSVRRIETDGGRTATRVVAWDRIAQRERAYRGKNVVLAAGTLESAKIAKKSGLADESGTLAKGLTDHQVFFTHFGLSPDSELYTTEASAKVVLQHRDASASAHSYNCIIELGADFNQGRYVDPDILKAHQDERERLQEKLCEIVFLTDSPLVGENWLEPDEGTEDGRPMKVRMERSTRADGALFDEMDALKDKILGALGAKALQDDQETQGLALQPTDIGAVAHEVGSLRMAGSPDAGVVDGDLKFWGYDNIYACDLSVFPSSPAANPTLTLGGLALRLGDHLRDAK
ncbi:unnamed protein product [Ostreobium quekettii]|uniref:Glucose-methanol-choline oxidoreductase C-terminal domain-containing protein n=1 Tax=Ostreobium quekettii TaxID=121088 RepID=A0A8S1IL94_9CHLO|nr:unnamed protein product [Ostreobium quekettii]|eukprot:evm.model.scf_66EXC.2 EVM.evm.TU.scf_66EXC.2   scf_66EXC:43478-46424(-)